MRKIENNPLYLGEVLSEPDFSTMVNSLEDETATKYDAMSHDDLNERLPRDLSTIENPFTAHNKGLTSFKFFDSGMNCGIHSAIVSCSVVHK